MHAFTMMLLDLLLIIQRDDIQCQPSRKLGLRPRHKGCFTPIQPPSDILENCYLNRDPHIALTPPFIAFVQHHQTVREMIGLIQ